ncbi:MAG: hypothetical protein IPO27_05185 [Bacteroidetes bacterium]|nr:hypothetical protein [Bacteroidota bacterium]
MKSLANILMAMLLVAASVAITACKKTTPAECEITITDSINRPVQGVIVVLRQDSVINPTTNVKANIKDQKTSDSNGKTYFSFEWEAVLNIEASKGNKKAKDYIILKQSDRVSKTVVLR